MRKARSRALQSLGAHTVAATVTAPLDTTRSEVTDPEEDEIIYVSVVIARAVLKRRKLSREQLLLLRTIYAAHLGTVLATDLGTKIGYSRSQFAGLMGAFGRRVSHTDGYADETSFFVQD
jgi:hypothetical protein